MTTEIAHQNQDIFLKVMAGRFKDKNLEFLGLNTPKIKELASTELPAIEANTRNTDVVFLLEDDTLLHLEFQIKAGEEELKRFMHYDARLALKQKRKVNTAVIYSGRVEKAPDILDLGSINYKVENVYMKGYDGDQECQNIVNKLKKKEVLGEEDYIKLAFLPLMKSENNEEEQTLKAAKVVKQLEGIPKDLQTFLMAALIVVSDKFLSDSNKKRLLEVLSMTEIEQMIREKREEEIALAAIKKGYLVEDISEITGLSKEKIEELKEELLS